MNKIMKTPYAPVRIILADDHEIFRDGFLALLQNQSHIQLLAEAADGQQLVSLTEKHLPDVVLTDIQMPVMDGLQATRIIAEKYPQVGIIALTMFSNDNMIIEMLEAGALGYLLKNAHKHEILDAINTVAQHKPYYCNATEIKMARLIANSRFNPNDPSKKIPFSEKEKEIICLICREFSNKEISAALHLSVRTIEGYRERILQKTNARNTAGIVIYAIKHNIYTPPESWSFYHTER